MAGAIFNSKSAICSVLLVVICSSLSTAEARDHVVGGSTDAWKIPSSDSDSLNQWAEKSRFLIGDSLVWKYDGEKDSVLQVTRKDYLTCNTSNPLAFHNDGNTVVKLEHAGHYYFISGAQGHCEKGQKMIVVVISQKHSRHGVSPAPAPAPAQFLAPAIAPASSASGFKGSLGILAFGVVLGLFLF